MRFPQILEQIFSVIRIPKFTYDIIANPPKLPLTIPLPPLPCTPAHIDIDIKIYIYIVGGLLLVHLGLETIGVFGDISICVRRQTLPLSLEQLFVTLLSLKITIQIAKT